MKSLTKELGNFLLLGFNGFKVSKELKNIILKYDLFGVILFSRNFKSLDQLTELCAELQAIKSRISSNPLIIGVDYEGGFVTRFNSVIKQFPSALAQSIGGNLKFTKNIYYSNSKELKKIGINCNFAPVLDISWKNDSFIGIRSFGNSPEIVYKFGKAAIEGIQDGGVIACGKHFPGIGKTIADSHFVLPIIKSKLKQLTQDMLPFKKLIDLNLNMIMTSHSIYSEIDKNNPSTFTYKINTEILRNKLKFKGLLITDDLCMQAIAKKYDLLNSVTKSISSGCDIAMICHNLEFIPLIIKHIDKALINKDLILQSIERKKHFFEFFKSIEVVAKKNNINIDLILNKIAKKTVQLIKCNNFNFSKKDKIILYVPKSLSSNLAEENSCLEYLFKCFNNYFQSTQIIIVDPEIKCTNQLLHKEFKTVCIFSGFSYFNNIIKIRKKFDLTICVKNYSDIKYVNKISDNIITTLGFSKEIINATINLIKNHEKS